MVTGIGAVPAAASAATGTGLGALDSEAFLKLMVAQLRYQNPLEPTDASTMMQQTASFTQVETLQKLASSQQTMLGMSEALMATGLVGKSVAAVRLDDSVMQGVVDGVRFTAEGPLLSIGGEEVAMAAIIQVGEVSAPDGEAPASQTVDTDPASASSESTVGRTV
jgi:flagellar basal-body rod modification protein FlgD